MRVNRKWLLLWVTCVFLVARYAYSTESVVRVVLDTDTTLNEEPQPVYVDLTANDSVLFSQPAAIPGELEFRVDTSHPMSVTLRSDTWWAPSASVHATDDDTALVVRLEAEPAAVIEGRFKTPPRAEPLTRLVAAFYLNDPETSANPHLTRQNCLVDSQKNSYRCVLPARIEDFRLVAVPFVSHFFWKVDLQQGTATRLGLLNLKEGGSLVGRVETWDGSEHPADIAIRVQPEGLDGVHGQSGRHAMISKARLMSKGYFHFPGLASGTYVLRVTGGQFAPATERGIQIIDGREANLLKPLVLRPRAELEIVVVPPVDPDGKPWVLQIGSPEHHEHLDPVIADHSGLAVLTNLQYGKYLVKIRNQQGDQLGYRFISIEQPSQFETIDVEVIQAKAAIYLGDDPLQAALNFGGATSVERVVITSDRKGRFSGLLPRVGRWEVDIESSSPTLRKSALVDVPPPDNGVSSFEILLPDTELRGRVLTREGLPPVGETRIVATSISSHERQTTVNSDPHGRFSLRGLAEGTTRVSTVSRLDSEGASEEITVNLSKDDAEEVTLSLRPMKLFTGIVTAQGRPLPGAEIRIEQGENLLMTSRMDRTDATGLWAAHAPKSTNRLNIWILPPGWGLFVTTHLANPSLSEEMVNLEVGVPPGGLSVRFPPEEQTGLSRREVLLRREGATIYPRFLKYWARLSDPTLPFPGEPGLLRSGPLHPGVYDICFLEHGTREWLSFQISAGWRSDDCERIEVSSYADVEVVFE